MDFTEEQIIELAVSRIEYEAEQIINECYELGFFIDILKQHGRKDLYDEYQKRFENYLKDLD